MSTIGGDPLQIAVAQDDRATVVALRGEASMIDAGRIRDELQCLTLGPQEIIVLDLSDLTFIGAEGIDALLAGNELSRLRHHSIRLVGPHGEIRRLLDLLRLGEVFPIYETVDEAVRA